MKEVLITTVAFSIMSNVQKWKDDWMKDDARKDSIGYYVPIYGSLDRKAIEQDSLNLVAATPHLSIVERNALTFPHSKEVVRDYLRKKKARK